MIEDIKKLGISDELYDEIINNLGYDLVLNMACNYTTIGENLNYLNNIGIDDLKDILLYKTHILFLEPIELRERFNNKNVRELVELINMDYANIEMINE